MRKYPILLQQEAKAAKAPGPSQNKTTLTRQGEMKNQTAISSSAKYDLTEQVSDNLHKWSTTNAIGGRKSVSSTTISKRAAQLQCSNLSQMSRCSLFQKTNYSGIR